MTRDYGWLGSVVGEPVPPKLVRSAMGAWTWAAERLGTDLAGAAERVAEKFRLSVADVDARDPQMAEVLGVGLSRQLEAVPIAREGRTPIFATCNPGNPDLLTQLQFHTGERVELRVADAQLMDSILGSLDHHEELDTGHAEWGAGEVAPPADPGVGRATLKDGSSSIMDRIVVQAVDRRASDIHVQPVGPVGRVRYRIDGVLRVGPQLTLHDFGLLLAQAKVVGRMDLADRRRPQDGRARVSVRGKTWDLRISTLPANGMESLVIRILHSSEPPRLEDLNLAPRALDLIREHFLEAADGMFVVTGPTGSGKTSLLYGALNALNTMQRDIHTIEDPVEYQVAGLAQVQVEPKADLTFASALRSILRQDPDVVLVGETRDEETARAVTQAALTGHLVATTLHTVDSITTLVRLRDLGVDPVELGEALKLVSAQRLVRRLCEDCREPVEVVDDPEEEWFQAMTGGPPAYQATGCSRCGHTGYRGRIPLVEILPVGRELQDGIIMDRPLPELRQIALDAGLVTLAGLAVEAVETGMTDAREVRRVLGGDLVDYPDREAPGDVVPVSGPSGEVGSTPEVGSDPDAGSTPDGGIPTGGDPLSGEALILSSHGDTLTALVKGVKAAGLSVCVTSDIPATAVQVEARRPALLVVDLTVAEGAEAGYLRTFWDALPHPPPAPGLVVVPADADGLERTLLEHGFTDFLAAPPDPAAVAFMARQIVRRTRVLGDPFVAVF